MLVYPNAPYVLLPYISWAGNVLLEFVSCRIVRSNGRNRFSFSCSAQGAHLAGYVSAEYPHIAIAYHLTLVDALLLDRILVRRFYVLLLSFSYWPLKDKSACCL
jgi:hypothetical protein